MVLHSLKALDEEEARLQRPLPQPVPPSSDSDDDSDVSEETQSSMDREERQPNGFKSPRSKR